MQFDGKRSLSIHSQNFFFISSTLSPMPSRKRLFDFDALIFDTHQQEGQSKNFSLRILENVDRVRPAE